jgi:hypothetical protein
MTHRQQKKKCSEILILLEIWCSTGINITTDFFWDMVLCSWVEMFRYGLLSPSSSYKSLFYTWGQKAPSKRWYLTAKWIVSLLTCPRPRQLYLTRNLATSRKFLYLLQTSWKKEMFYNCLYLLETLLKGHVFTTVFIFCRLDEQRKCFYNCLYLL